MTTLTEQVAEVKVGEYVKADFLYPDAEVSATGEVKNNFTMEFYIGETFIADDEGNPAPYLVSIHRVPRPIPSEPEVGSFALLDDGSHAFSKNFQGVAGRWIKIYEPEDQLWDWKPFDEIFPHIIRLYTPSGDEVTEFEYYKSEGN